MPNLRNEIKLRISANVDNAKKNSRLLRDGLSRDTRAIVNAINKATKQILLAWKGTFRKARTESKRASDAIRKDSNKVKTTYIANSKQMRLHTSGMRTVIGKLRNEFLLIAFIWTSFRKVLSLKNEAQDLARDGNEIDSKFSAVFKHLTQEASDWAIGFGKSVGRATMDVKQWMATLQDTFVPLGFARSKASEMSKSLVELGVDVASFSNKASSDVIRDFTSALVGNHETVRKYGIIISEGAIAQEALNLGLKKNYSQLTDLEKVQARYNIILNGTKDAQGDALRTANELANVEKRKEAIRKDMLEMMGRKLIPLTKTYNELMIDWYQNLIPIKEQITEISSQYNKLEGQSSTLDSLIKRHTELTDKTKLNADEQRELKTVIAGIAEIAPGAITAFDDYGRALDVNTTKARDFYEVQLLFTRERFRKAIEGRINDYMKEKYAIQKANKAIRDQNGEISKATVKRKNLKRQLDASVKTFGDLSKAEGFYADNQKRLRIQLAFAEKKVNDEKRKLNKVQLQEISNIAHKRKEMDGYLRELMKYFDVGQSTVDLTRNIANEFGLDGLAAHNLALDMKRVSAAIKDVNDAGGGKPLKLVDPKDLDRAKKALEKLLAKLRDAQAELSSFDKQEGIERAKFLAKKRIELEIEALEAEQEKYNENSEMYQVLGQQIVAAKELMNTELLKIDKKYLEELRHEMTEYLEGYLVSAEDKELAKLDSKYGQELNLLKEMLDEKLLTEEVYQAARTNLIDEYAEARKEAEWQRWEEQHQWQNAGLKALESGYDQFFSSITDMEMTGKERREAIWKSMKSTFASILASMLKDAIMNMIKSSAQTVVTGKIIEAAMAKAALFNTLATGGTNAAAAIPQVQALMALLYGTPAAHGAYVKRTPGGAPYVVGEGGDDELIIPVSKFWKFAAGVYRLPGGYGVENLPTAAAGAVNSTVHNVSRSMNTINHYNAPGIDFGPLIAAMNNGNTAGGPVNMNLTLSFKNLNSRDKILLSRMVDEGRVLRGKQ